MDRINQQGIDSIVAIQRLPRLGGLIHLAGVLGDDIFLMLIVAVGYWGLNPAFGATLAVVLGLATAVNHLLKLVFHLPRPYWLNIRVRAGSKSHDYGLPSRHVQNAVLTLGVFLDYTPSIWWPWVLVGGLVLVGLVALSRMYVGVHFPADVVVGFGLGLAGWAVYAAAAAGLSTWWLGLGLGAQLGWAFGLSLIYLAVVALILKALAATPDPHTWSQTAVQTAGGSGLKPRDATYQFATAGSLFGLGAALALAGVWLTAFAQSGAGGWALVGRVVVGVVGLGILWFGSEWVRFKNNHWGLFLFNYAQHALLLLWLFLLAPLVFAALNF